MSSCRAKYHFFADCKRKRRCTQCKHRFERYFVVEKENDNKGKLFICNSNNCEFWEWVVKEESSNLFEHGSVNLINHVKNETVEEIAYSPDMA